MRQLGRSFPGSILVFCTLRSKLDPKEKRALKRLATLGRSPIGPADPRNPVMILTGVELFGEPAPACWKNLRLDEAVLERMQNSGDLRQLADITQQIHLDMEPYDEWLLKIYHQQNSGGQTDN